MIHRIARSLALASVMFAASWADATPIARDAARWISGGDSTIATELR